MKFEEILPYLRDNKKVRLDFWGPNTYIHFGYVTSLGVKWFAVCNEHNEDYSLTVHDLNDDTWEIYEEVNI